jgi:hypothetical protein
MEGWNKDGSRDGIRNKYGWRYGTSNKYDDGF